MLGRIILGLMPLVPEKIIKKIAMTYVAGVTTEDAINTCRKINDAGMLATLDILGEEVKNVDASKNVSGKYCNLLELIDSKKLKSNISVKLTHLGIRISKQLCFENIFYIVKKARDFQNFVRIDMEDSSLTQITLDIYKTVRKEMPNVGVAVQSYLRRTEEDMDALAKESANIRLCKGIYKEKENVAFQKKSEIRENFLKVCKNFLKSQGYVAIATHDRIIINEMLEYIDREKLPKDKFEFQALLGVPIQSTLEELVRNGFRVRIYIPFGEDWKSYGVRRMRENPHLAYYMIKNMFYLQQ